MICPELEDNHFEEWVELGDEWIELDRICIDVLVRITSCYDADNLASTSSYLLRRGGVLRGEDATSVDHQ